jgi:hypothetical protein
MGIALESMRMDKIREAISQSDDTQGILNYCQQSCLRLVQNRSFRQQVRQLLLALWTRLSFLFSILFILYLFSLRY